MPVSTLRAAYESISQAQGLFRGVGDVRLSNVRDEDPAAPAEVLVELKVDFGSCAGERRRGGKRSRLERPQG